jgi:transposase
MARTTSARRTLRSTTASARTTSHKHSSIIALKEEGLSYRAISFRLGIPKTTVADTWNRYKTTSSIKDRPRSGRPAILTDREERNAIRILNQVGTAAAVGCKFRQEGRDISDQTIRRAFRKHGLVARIKRKKPLLRKTHRSKCLAWAKAHKDWTIEDWAKVIWSDESKFSFFGSHSQKYYWKTPGEPLREQHVRPTVKYGGGSVMIWGCMTWKGVGNITRIEGTMDSKMYQEILKAELLDTYEWQELDPEEYIFQQDNDPKHTSQLLKNWFAEQDFKVMIWPAQSPNLNPIEHLWDEVEWRLQCSKENPTNEEGLYKKLLAVWDGVEVETVRKLVCTMPQRVADVIKAKGGYTRW